MGIVELGSGQCPAVAGIEVFCFLFFRKGRPAESLGIVERGSGPCPAEAGIKVFCFLFFRKGRKERYG